MGIEMGRVSGPLLSENLLRNGENLAFDTTLLYFDVNSGYVGVNTDSPTRAITISGTSNIADILVTTRADIAALTVVSNKVQNVNGSITFRPDQTTNPTVSLQELQTANLSFTNQKIENLIADSDIDFAANGTGQVKFFAPTVNVNGTLHSTGDITWDGTITFGNDSTDGVTFKADITSNIVPDVNNTYDLGTSDRYWQKLYSVNLNATTITTPQITANNIDLLLTQGYTFYVSVNGNDTNYGNHLHSTYRTIKQALTVAQPGDEIVIFPGTYTEIFPLTVPQGVSVRGMDIRNVIVKPTTGTNTNNAFLLNGDTTVSFLTVRDFYSPGNGFSFANNFTVSTRSPYVYNVTVITASATLPGSPVGSAQFSSSNYLSVPNNTALNPGTGNFTIEFWVKLNSTTNNASFWRGHNNGVDIFMNGSSKLALGQAQVSTLITDSVNMTTGSWVHVAAVKNGGTITLYKNGVSVGSSGSAPNFVTNTINYIGNQGSFKINGYMTNLRVVIGSAVYTSAFTPPTSPLTAVAGTQLLLLEDTSGNLLKDSSANNFTVTNSGSVPWSASSPFPSGGAILSAGNGALVDGSLANSFSNQASMLFHAVTIIVPDAIGIHATNGTRVEWLNSFTYFANKGIYLTDGTLAFASQGNTAAGYDTIVGFYGQTGILLTGPNAITVTVDVSSVGAITITSVSIGAVSGIYTSAGGTRWIINLGKFGAELRSINSANLYGTFGAVADGASTKGYLVGHNFSYIGAGIDTTNDATLVNQANEIVAINGGQLFYESIDQQGDFRIGDIFYINQKTGDVSFNAQSLNFNASGGLVFESQYGITSVTPQGVQTGNIRFEHNSIIGLLGPVNLFAKSSSTRLNTDVFVTGSIDITNDVNVKGNVFFGNETSDTVAITPNLTQTIKPNQTNTFTLGKKGVTPEVWNTAFLKLVDIDGITQLANNTISTLTTDTDLQLIAAGTGKIQVSTTDVQINDNLTIIGTTTIDGTSSLKNLEIVGTTTLTGDINQTGSTGITGLFANNNIIITGANSYFTVPNIKLQTNKISATFLNDDLTFAANGLGGVVLDSKLKFTDSTISNKWVGATTDLQKSVIFSPNGTGNTVVNTTRFLTIPYANNSDRVLAAFGEVRQNSTTTWYEGYLPTGNVSFNNLYDFDKNTYITAELTPGNNDKTLRFSIDGTVRATITPTALSTSMVNIDNVQLTDNIISNTDVSNDLEFFPSGAGNTNINGVLIRDSKINNQLDTPLILSNTGTGYVKFNGKHGVVIPSGNDTQRPATAEIGEIRYSTEREYIEVYDGTTWIVSTGAAGNISENDATEIMNFWSIILG